MLTVKATLKTWETRYSAVLWGGSGDWGVCAVANSPVWVRFDPGRMEPVCFEESTSIESSFYDLCVCVCVWEGEGREGGGTTDTSDILFQLHPHPGKDEEEESYPSSSHLVQCASFLQTWVRWYLVRARHGWDGTRYEPDVGGMEPGTSQTWVGWNPVQARRGWEVRGSWCHWYKSVFTT